jgi:ABC-type Mn2+/Zn2+ transport system ATPase subunit
MRVPDRAGDRIVLRDVVRRVGRRRPVLAGVSAEFRAGQVCWLTGRNGSGKSTLLRVAAGVDRPDAGTVLRPPGGVFLLPERVPLLPAATPRGLFAALAGALGVAPRPGRGLLAANLDRLGFADRGSGQLRTLSKGNLQKVYLAVGFALRPAPLLLDEPLTGVDAAGERAVRELAGEAAEDARVVLITAHQPRFAGQVVRLADGHLHLEPAAPAAASPGPVRICLGRAAVGRAPAGWPSPEWTATVSADEHLHLAVPAGQLSAALTAIGDRGLTVRGLHTPGSDGDWC